MTISNTVSRQFTLLHSDVDNISLSLKWQIKSINFKIQKIQLMADSIDFRFFNTNQRVMQINLSHYNYSGSTILAACMCLYVLRIITVLGSYTDILRLAFVLITQIIYHLLIVFEEVGDCLCAFYALNGSDSCRLVLAWLVRHLI